MKTGNYIRTKDGIIDKVIIEYNGKCASPTCNCKHVSCVHNYYDEDTIIKSSPNIIDLIEVGDILTIKDIFGNLSKVEVDENFKLLTGRIISIITKEQFEAMQYKIGGSDV